MIASLPLSSIPHVFIVFPSLEEGRYDTRLVQVDGKFF